MKLPNIFLSRVLHGYFYVLLKFYPWQVLSCSLALAVLVRGHPISTQLPRGVICDNSSSAWPKDGPKIGCPIILTTFLRKWEDKISCKLEELDEFCIAWICAVTVQFQIGSRPLRDLMRCLEAMMSHDHNVQHSERRLCIWPSAIDIWIVQLGKHRHFKQNLNLDWICTIFRLDFKVAFQGPAPAGGWSRSAFAGRQWRHTVACGLPLGPLSSIYLARSKVLSDRNWSCSFTFLKRWSILHSADAGAIARGNSTKLFSFCLSWTWYL